MKKTLWAFGFLVLFSGCGESGPPLPSLSIDDVVQAEGDAGTTTFTFTITLSEVADGNVTVRYDTADGTAATIDGDYILAGGTAAILQGNLTTTVDITVNGDAKYEADETFTLVLSNPSGATIADGVGWGTIQNDDTMPAVSIADESQSEGDAGTQNFQFDVTLSAPCGLPVAVDYTTTDGTASSASGDYVAVTDTLTITAGDTTERIYVTVNGDTLFETNETFTVDLDNPSNATIADAQGIGTIENDDTPPSLSIADVQDLEGDSGTKTFTFTVTLSEISGVDAGVDYNTIDDTAMTIDNDYVGASGTLTIPAGNPSGTIDVTVNGDTKIEPDEQFVVNLTNEVNATIDVGQGYGTIENDDFLKVYVDPTGDNSDGSTWAKAFNTVQAGVNAAAISGGCEVWVAAATYDNGGGSGPVVAMADDVYLYGGFEGFAGGAGAQETLRSQRHWLANLTVLNGLGNARHVITVSSNSGARVDGFVVIAGSASGATPDDRGGGVYALLADSLVIANCEFVLNYALGGGAGIYIEDCSPTVVNCRFDTNVLAVSGRGGGILTFGNSAIPDIVNCTFEDNGDNSADYGGGLCSDAGSAPILTNCTFVGNNAVTGDGLCSVSAFAFVTNCVFWGNGGQDIGESGGTCDADFCSLEFAWPFGAGNIFGDPQLDAQLRLTSASPCIDAGDNFAVPDDFADIDADADTLELLPVDLDHNARFTDDPATTDSGNGSPPIVDLGAFEYQPWWAVVVELTWSTPGDPDETDNDGSDMDLHLRHSDGAWLDTTWDCHWNAMNPDWGVIGYGADDPWLDVDDPDGAGPETIALDFPEAGATYRIGVHYATDNAYGPSFATVRIYIRDVLVAEYVDQFMADGEFWQVADIDGRDLSITDVDIITPGVP